MNIETSASVAAQAARTTKTVTPQAPALTATDPTALPAPAPTVEPAPAPAPTGSRPPASKLLDKLASGHFSGVADLRHRMRLNQEIADAKLELPEPPAPRGQGAAYQKFLEAYRAMTAPPPPEPQPIPTVVPAAVDTAV